MNSFDGNLNVGGALDDNGEVIPADHQPEERFYLLGDAGVATTQPSSVKPARGSYHLQPLRMLNRARLVARSMQRHLGARRPSGFERFSTIGEPSGWYPPAAEMPSSPTWIGFATGHAGELMRALIECKGPANQIIPQMPRRPQHVSLNPKQYLIGTNDAQTPRSSRLANGGVLSACYHK